MSDSAYQELAELWEAVFGDKPSVVAEPALTAEILVRCLPTAEPYSFRDEDTGGVQRPKRLKPPRPPRSA